jgi:hypothetical protein
VPIVGALLLAAAAPSQAVPIAWSFDLMVTELRTDADKIVDPYYTQFHLGQAFQGSFVYDPDTAISVGPFSTSYYNTFQYSVQIGDALIGNTGGYRPHTNVQDAASDAFNMFDEVPNLLGGFFGSTGGYIEQTYFTFEDGGEHAVEGGALGSVDFSLFGSTRWNFWWQPPDGPGSAGYSRLLMYGTIGNVHEVPEPGTLGLLAAALASFGFFSIRRRRQTLLASAN